MPGLAQVTSQASVWLALLALFAGQGRAAAADSGRKVVGFSTFSSFATTEAGEGRRQLVSPLVDPGMAWDQLVVSWNWVGQGSDGLTIEAQVAYPDAETKFYHVGDWTFTPGRVARQSGPKQQDAQGFLDTDTLCVTRKDGKVRLRLTVDANWEQRLTFLGLSFCDTAAPPRPADAKSEAWGRSLEVQERCQGDYPEGASSWCSPTATSMAMNFWSNTLGRPELDHGVRETAAAINDPNWPGTGNWPFNTAFAGSHSGIRAYVARLASVADLERWILAGVPVPASVSYNLLKGEDKPGNGHIVVCVGFTEAGDLIVNDPGRRQVRRVYPRAHFIRAWADSHNTAYLIHPADHPTPSDPDGLWFDSGHPSPKP